MRVSKTWQQFKHMLDVAHPKRGDTLQLPLMAEWTPPSEIDKPEKERSLFDRLTSNEAAN
jgi:hypothetical protein